MPGATGRAGFACAGLTTFYRPDELGLEVSGECLEPDRAVLACQITATEADRWCRRCGEEGVSRDNVTRRLAHEPFGWRPTTLSVTIRRYGRAQEADLIGGTAAMRPSLVGRGPL